METIYNLRIFIIIAILVAIGYFTSRRPKETPPRSVDWTPSSTQIPTELPYFVETRRPAKTTLRDSVIFLIGSVLIYALFHMQPP